VKPWHRTTLAAVAAIGLAAAGAARSQEALPFGACIDALKRERAQQRPPVSVETFERFVRDAQDMRAAIRAASEGQPEFTLPIWDYIARLVDGQRVDDGRKVLATHALPLRTIASRHGVDAATVVAVFGVETDYGRIEGKHRVVDATLSRACLDLQSKER
jgi:glucose-6-phosphate 1-epimerase